MTAPAAILVVDDEPVIRETLAEFLLGEGFAVDVRGSGEEAVKQIQARCYDLILCDVNLPGIDGIEVLELAARSSPETMVVLIMPRPRRWSSVEARK